MWQQLSKIHTVCYFLVINSSGLESNDTDFYIAKFSTLYNLTEWQKSSRSLNVNETVRGVHFNSNFGVCYIAVEVKTGLYMNRSNFDTWVNPSWTNKTNIALIAYDQYCM